MQSRMRAICWLALITTLLALSAPGIRAADGWASEASLGDVAVSLLSGTIKIYKTDVTGPVGDPKTTLPLTVEPSTGAYAGLAFDASLNLVATNTAAGGAGNLHTFNEATHVLSPSTPTENFSPQSIVFAADGSYYVASRACTGNGGSRTCTGTIRRFVAGVPTNFSVQLGSSSTCIGIDLDPDQDRLYVVDGATQSAQRRIRAFNVSAPSTVSLIALPGTGAACGIRALAPQRNQGSTYGNRSFLIADRDNIKWIKVLNPGSNPISTRQLQSFVAFVSSSAPRNWIDVDLDPNTFDLWAINDGKAINARTGESLLARFRMTPDINLPPADQDTPALGSCGTQNACALVNLFADRPRGVTLNGALRAAQTVWISDLKKDVPKTAEFLQDSKWEHWWIGTANVDTPYAVRVFEVKSDGSGVAPINGVCPPSLDVDCRIAANFPSQNGFPSPTGKGYSRGRNVVYREIPLQNTAAELKLGVKFPDFVDPPDAGTECTSATKPQAATALLRDPFKHDLFSLDVTLAVFPADTIIRTTRTNDSIVVDRHDAQYVAWLKKPELGAAQNQRSTMTVELQIRAQGTCAVVSTVDSEQLVLTATDATEGSPDKGTPIADSKGVYRPINANGQTWTSLANVLRTNVYIDPNLFKVGKTYKFCVNSVPNPSLDSIVGPLPDPPPDQTRAIGEVCRNVLIN